LNAEEILSRLDQGQIANAHLNSAKEFWDHPQLQARERWREIDSPVGSIQSMLPPVTMEGVPPRMDPVPALGQHTRQILMELGYNENEIDRLAEGGTI